MPTRLDISHHTEDETVTVVVAGELDYTSGAPLTDLLDRLQSADRSRVVLDLRGLEFMDSTGLGIMLAANRRAEESGGELTIVPSEPAAHVIRATGLDDRLHIQQEMQQSLERRFGASHEAVSEARKAFDAAFPDLDTAVRDDARIIVSELVTNGVRHGAQPDGWVQLVVRRTGGLLRIEVTDSGGSPSEPHIPPRDPERTSGWGLLLVERLAASWGVSGGPATTVWCELPVG